MTVLAFAANPEALPTFLSGANIPYVLEIYARYLQDPSAVDASWAQYFAAMGDHGHAALHDMLGASWSPKNLNTVVENTSPKQAVVVNPPKAVAGQSGSATALSATPTGLVGSAGAD